MSSELVLHISEPTRPGDSEHLPQPDRYPGLNGVDALEHISLLIARSHDVNTAPPDIAQAIRALLDLQIVSLSLGEQVWVVHPDDDVDPPPSLASQEASGAASSNRPVDTRQSRGRLISIVADDENDRPGSSGRIPIHLDGTPSGFMLIQIDNRTRLDTETIALLEKIGDTLAEAIDMEQRASRRHASDTPDIDTGQLLDILSYFATPVSIDATIQPFLCDVAGLLKADSVSLIIADPVQPLLISSNSVSVPDDKLLYLIAAPIVRLALDLRHTQTGFIKRRKGYPTTRTLALAAPILAGYEAIGRLIAERNSGKAFSVDESEAATAIARHLSFHLEREQRDNAYSRQNRLLTLVERITGSISRSTADDDLFTLMAREIREAFGYDCSIVMIEGDRLVFKANETTKPDRLSPWIDEGIPFDVGIMGRVARTGKPVFLPDVSEDIAFLDAGLSSQSEIAVPITVANEIVGVINIESSETQALGDADFEIMLILANHVGIALNNRQLIASEREARVAIEAIQRVSTIVAETLDPDESLLRISETLGDLMGYPLVTLGLIEGEELLFKATYGLGDCDVPGTMSIHQGVAGKVARTGVPVFLESAIDDPFHVPLRPDLISEICVPIRCNGELVGILNVEGTAERPLTENDLHLLTTFAEHAGVLLNNARAYAALSKEAALDVMTGVPNLRHFQQQLQIEIDRARREENQLTLAVIDMDDLKAINDSHGHLVGDQVLRELANRMSAQLHDRDLLARYAGDEFVVILPGVDQVQALEIARRLIEAVRSTPLELPDVAPIWISISVGIATFPNDATTSTELLRAADLAMYLAKESGKNRIDTAQHAEDIRQRSQS
ncbi:hypothetical protein BH23CHL2_BH23CHL2_18780 [soil metagenome]